MKNILKQFVIAISRSANEVIAKYQDRKMIMKRTEHDNFVLQIEFKRKNAKDAPMTHHTKNNGKVSVTRVGYSMAGLVMLRKLIDATLGSEEDAIKTKQAHANLEHTKLHTLDLAIRMEKHKEETESRKRSNDISITKKAFEWLFSKTDVTITKDNALDLWMYEKNYITSKPASIAVVLSDTKVEGIIESSINAESSAEDVVKEREVFEQRCSVRINQVFEWLKDKDYLTDNMETIQNEWNGDNVPFI